MNVRYLFSSPNGDIPLGSEDHARPFLITPSQAHPFLTLVDYFESIKAFLLKDEARSLIRAVQDRLKRETPPDRLQELFIRSEKHGALYHLASVDVFVDAQVVKFAVNTAVSEKGKECSVNEYGILNHLNNFLHSSYLPNVYFKGEVACRAGDEKHETLTIFLSEWFVDYHEWHFSVDEKDGKQKICIWDIENGNRYATKEESFEIFRQTSKILTLYYDTHDFRQIYPWHHSAGDFVVKTRDGIPDIKLTTVRRYQSIMDSISEDEADPIIAIVYFFLNLTIHMRLDKLDGAGESVWAGDFSVRAAIMGFFEALRIIDAEGRYNLGEVNYLLSLLKSFDEEELGRLFHPLFRLYRKGDPTDFSVIKANMKSHVSQLYHSLQDFHL